MDHDLARRAMDIFELALERDSTTLDEFLQAACNDNATLRLEVDALIAANKDSQSLLFTTDLRDESTVSKNAEKSHAENFEVGQVLLDRYEITAVIGSGGMGEVFRALDRRLHRDVAIKALRTSSSASDLTERFRRELQTVASLSHPNVMTLYDIVEHSGNSMFAVMEYVPGKTFRSMIGEGVDWSEVVRLARGVARGLGAAHALNLMHRDIKPENVIVTPTGHTKLLDFGLARPESPTIDQLLTIAGGITPGTIPYMSPEQADGRTLTVATDIFSFGTVLYEMLSGNHPFRAGTALQTLKRVDEANPTRIQQLVPGIPQPLIELVDQMLHREPEERPSIEEVAIRLDRLSEKFRVDGQNDSTLLSSVPTNLANRRLQLTGRESESDDLARRLTERPIVTVVGPGGVGKTSIAFATAQNKIDAFPGGVWVCEFASLRHEEEVVGAIAGVLDGNAGASGAGLDTIVGKLTGSRTLLIFDNCEHVIEAAAELAETLSQRLPDLALLATSREPLDVAGEFVYRIEGLQHTSPHSPAAELFVARATALAEYEDTPEDRGYVENIVTQLEGLPLAIELAAPRLSAMSIKELAEALGDQMNTLRSRRRSKRRQGTIERALAWSFDLLEPDEREMLLALSVFAAPFTADGAIEISGNKTGGKSRLQRLVDQSVVVRRERRGNSRYRLLEPIRQFCSARIGEDELAAARACHAKYYAQRASLLARGIDGEGELSAAEALNAEWPDLREAFAFGREKRLVEIAVDPLVALSRTILFHLRCEAYEWLIEAEQVFGKEVASRADVNAVIANGYWVMGNPELADEYIARAEKIAVTPMSLRAKYFLRFSQNRFEESAAAAFEAEQLAQELVDSVETRWWSNAFRVCPLTMANPDDPRVDEKLASASDFISGLDWPTGHAFLNMAKGTVAITRRELPNAYRHMSKAIDIAVGCGNRWIESVSGLIANSVADPSVPPQKRLASALAHLKQLVEMGEETHYPLAVRAIVTDLVDCGHTESAANWSGIADCLNGVGDKNEFSPRYPESVAMLVDQLGTTRLAELQAIGATLTIQQLLELSEGSLYAVGNGPG